MVRLLKLPCLEALSSVCAGDGNVILDDFAKFYVAKIGSTDIESDPLDAAFEKHVAEQELKSSQLRGEVLLCKSQQKSISRHSEVFSELQAQIMVLESQLVRQRLACSMSW